MRPTYHDIEPVKYFWREWYVKALDAKGSIWHFGPWLTHTAAVYCAAIIGRRTTATTDETSDTMRERYEH